MKRLATICLLAVFTLRGQDAAPAKGDPWAAFHFLEGTWEARAQGAGGTSASGVYSFRLELRDHVLARHSSSDPGCKGPATFDCEHSDLLYAYAGSPDQALRAIYFDNEGHVIHYILSSPSADTAIFLSEPSAGPRFRLTYQLKNSVMTGKFQALMPGQSDWHSYLEWAGPKK